MHNPNHDDEIAEINVVPLVDVVLVILIIFLVTATLIAQGAIPIDLPQAKTAVIKEELKDIPLTIKSDGTMFINEDKTDPKLITETLRTLKANNPNIIIKIRADKNTQFGYVVKAIDACRAAGIERYNIETLKDERI
ncbi:biopolymer transport protein ExbD [Thermodesulfobium acidiphilum]|uniref:Biopolymer transport protein ExbD n=1 Tax=Thermodesulfobium acidiphilum TaxID=1794699 RepID=A0A2R4W1S1_THEAF|nr:biopolymer transporter ExbD [Thermodesulfobium acidiphilum]AWB10729.1 biopolymer transport protein ExbD [Thermodesulfobium acidiphilum]